ncbi:MAG: DUF4492 domain-containing protein [Bdellovibrionales bacterium RIFOXYD12_FULL_39_22]|nr:MAG: DUF4492 domain-containing protein [Bdellovibrionales bacterium RIFOXYB1_FULL_39_21]OFZ43825.1 MAG: DUF4492 domain-containing protein [Bdellovibrionales bacterium RIFOXYC12_FULL_39_17]OFZ48841.1 MAG: DUF4492 domain-containing protein [Bdellovibrionales bacterium RIFOXYC1_FULL_39_130]OFZ76574.1 MAG: DUF4492 domain-containing protein [Bdellovibrionales bacterium RIFOXYD1_FULL_39_84]OFZ94808.1 MAG: DUF4492 domain-containing protein [Bdellovibrionales bacterium RIFOXYD12_FULL_39_22]HLE12232
MAIVLKVITFYIDGFRTMKVGRKLWVIILLKLFVMFAILKFFFFPNYLTSNFSNDQERALHVMDNLTRADSLSNY